MKFLHISDLHLGRRLREADLEEDQDFLLKKIFNIAVEKKTDAVLVAGDVYDRSVPTVGAVRLFDEFLTRLSKAHIPVYVISGNHDSAERLGFADRLLDEQGVHLASVFSGEAVCYEARDEFGSVYIWSLPFLKPAFVRHFYPEETIESYTDAVAAVLRRANPDFSARNVLIAHQFVTAAGNETQRCESETLSLGTLDNVDASVFDGFDYVALGHVHGAQRVGRDTVRYCGAPFKYSVDEARSEKGVLLVELLEKGRVDVEKIPLSFLRDVRRVKGTLEQILTHAQPSEDYMYVVLTDDTPLTDAAARVRAVYPNLVKLEFSTRHGQDSAPARAEEMLRKTPLELFGDFYKQVHGSDMTEEENTLMKQVFEEVRE